MQVGLKIWRYDSKTGDRALREYEVDAPEEATLLDCLDIVKDQHDGSLAYRKSCRMMICGSCGMRMDGGAVLACKVRMYDIAQAGHVPVISAMGNLPIVKDLVVDMDAVLGEDARRRAVPAAALRPGARSARTSSRRSRWTSSTRSRSASTAAAASPSATRWSPTPTSSARRRSRRGCASSATRATAPRSSGSRSTPSEHGIWDCTRCYFCNERCPKGVDPRDAIAKLGAEAMKNGIDRDMGAKHAKWFVTSAKTTGWLRETELVPKTQGIVSSIKEMKFAMGLAVKGKVPPPFPPHVAAEVHESRALYDLVKTQGRDGAAGHRPGRAGARRGSSPTTRRPRAGRRTTRPIPRRARTCRASAKRPRRSHVKKVAYYKGCLASLSAKELDISTQALAPKVGLRADRARVGHLLRRRRHPRGGARLLPAPERAHPRLRRGDRVRHADDGLQRLHAQPAAGEPPAADRRRPARARQRQPRAGRRAPLPRARSR